MYYLHTNTFDHFVHIGCGHVLGLENLLEHGDVHVAGVSRVKQPGNIGNLGTKIA